MWDIHMALGGIPDISPSVRRRSYSDPRQKRNIRLPIRKQSVSPPPRFKDNIDNVNPITPTSSGYGSGLFDGGNNSGTAPIIVRQTSNNNTEGGASGGMAPASLEGSPQRCHSPYSLGSPTGGPFNCHGIGLGLLSPVSEVKTSPSTDFTSSGPGGDLLPMRRPRLSSLSEVPSVAPIPENSPLEDTPYRPPFRLDPLPKTPYKKENNVDSAATVAGKVDTKTSAETGGGPKQDLEKQTKEINEGGGGSFRPRAGTWSMASSRRHKMKQDKEEEAKKQRIRRKSGDDLYSMGAPSVTTAGTINRKDGLLDSIRPRSKSDAKSQTRVRRKSGDDLLTSKDKKKEASPGFLDTFRPRSKSDASKGKKPNLMTTVKNAVQHSLVSPGGPPRSGRRSGEATPVEQSATHDVYHTWHAGSGAKSTIGKVMDLFRRSTDGEERQRKKSGGKHEKGLEEEKLVIENIGIVLTFYSLVTPEI